MSCDKPLFPTTAIKFSRIPHKKEMMRLWLAIVNYDAGAQYVPLLSEIKQNHSMNLPKNEEINYGSATGHLR